MKKSTIAQIVTTGAAVTLAVTLTLSGCGEKETDGSPAVSGTSVSEAVGSSSADEADQSVSSDSGTAEIPVTDEDLPVDECFQLGTYKGLKLTKNNYIVTDEMVDDYIASSSEVEEVTSPGAAVQDGDTVNIAYEGEIDGESFEGGTETSYDLVIGSDSFIDGFEDGIIGMKKGETKDLNLRFPDDYQMTEYAGKDVIFHVTVNKISRPVSGDSDEEKEQARATLEEQYQEYSDNELLGNAWAAVRDGSSVICIRQTDVDSFRNAVDEMLKSQLDEQGISFDDYLESQSLSQDEYDKNLDSYAKELAKEELMIEALESAENISTEDEEYQEELQTLADQSDTTVDEMKEQIPEIILKQYVETKRLSERIVDAADVTEEDADASSVSLETN